jgi:hypothetical protein
MALTPYQFQQLLPKEQMALIVERGIDLALTIGDEEQEARLAYLDVFFVEMTFESSTLTFLGGLPITDSAPLSAYLEEVRFAPLAA